MKISAYKNFGALIIGLVLISITLTDCKKTENPIKYPLGTFPDTVLNMSDINSSYDDYNISLYQLYGDAPIVFSSNRGSSGGQFDLEQAFISFSFDQTIGQFELTANMFSDIFLIDLITAAETPGNDFGPYRLFSSLDGYEYLILASESESGDLDLFYTKNQPRFENNIPPIDGPYPVNLLNSDSDDAYLSFDSNMDSAYFVSDRDGNFDIYLHQRPESTELSEWFTQSYTASTRADSVNSTNDDKCPIIFGNMMVFASDRAGGLGGFDLYYSLFKNGNWGSPVNMGPGINSSSDEYRPVLGFHPEFTNIFMMFSSNRPGGKGGFDLYFTGIEYPD